MEGIMKKKIFISLAAVALAGSLFSPTSFAGENNGNAYGKIDLVGLGDSITYGYNLPDTNNNTNSSAFAFPYLIGDDKGLQLDARNLGVPRWTTSDLLKAIKTDKNFKQSIKHAEYITLDIGSNDLLQTLNANNGNPIVLQQKIIEMLPILTNNLDQIIQEISTLTDAPIVVYNIYNPFQLNDPMHFLVNQLLTNIVNPAIGIVVSQNNAKLADAYTAFGEEQFTYVRQGDIHPTIAGQKVLAEIGEESLGLN